MSFFESPITEPRQRHLIIKVATGGASLKDVAKENGFDAKELHYWVELYKLHGESILSPEQRAQAELELFKLKYPQGRPDQDLVSTVDDTFVQSKRLLFVLIVLIPSLFGIGFSILSFSERFNLLNSLLVGAFAGFIAMMIFSFIAIMWMTLRTSRRLVTGKIDEIVYDSEHRKIVSEQEVVGGLELAVDYDQQQGGLALAQDAGGLEVATAQGDSTHVVFDHSMTQEEVEDVEVNADKKTQT